MRARAEQLAWSQGVGMEDVNWLWRGTMLRKLRTPVTKEEVRFGERDGVWPQPAFPVGEAPEWPCRAPVDIPLCARGRKTRQHRTK